MQASRDSSAVRTETPVHHGAIELAKFDRLEQSRMRTEDQAESHGIASHSLSSTMPTREAASAQSSACLLPATGSDTEPPEMPRNPSEVRPSLSDWKFQFAVCAISVASLACLVTVALLYRNRPKSDWPSDTISINGVVAALTTILKGSLMAIVASSISQAKWFRFIDSSNSAAQLREMEDIDQASRGPWGSVLYMARYPFQMSLISLGAFVTTVALALDLSTQQIVSIETRMVADPFGIARVPWAQTVNGTMPNTEAAFYEGFWRNELEDLPVVCSSGNCTWDKIPTIGVCGACFDYTSRLQINCSEVTSDTAGAPLKLCNYTASDQYLLEPTIINTIPPNALIKDYTYDRHKERLTTTHIGRANERELCELLNLTKKIDTMCSGAFEVIELDLDARTMPYDEYKSENSRFGNPRASLCGFWECLQAITVSLNSGKQSQHIEISPEAHRQLTKGPETYYLLHPFLEHPQFNMQSRNFSSDETLRYGISIQETHKWTFYNDSQFYGYEAGSLMDRWHATRDNRTEWVEQIAASLTKAVRLGYHLPEDEEDPYVGTALILEAYFEVQWLWILYPAFAVVAGLILFALIVRETQAQGRAVWTDSMLVPLLIDVENELRDAARGSSWASLAALGVAVGDRKVCMEPQDDAWILRGKRRMRLNEDGHE